MPIENVTANRAYQLPNVDNFIVDDVFRLVAAFSAIDLDVANLLVALAGKAAAAHSHHADEIEGLQAKFDALVGGAPGVLDTLAELATALGEDPNFATTITAALAAKLNASLYTAADVLAKVKTVDGTGSGLDADLLRGTTPSTFGLTLLAIADAAATRTALGLVTPSAFGLTLLAIADAAAARSSLGLVLAAAAEYRQAVANKVLTADKVWADAVPVAGGNITGTVSVNFATFIHRKNTLTGNVTFGTTSNVRKGSSGWFELTQDGTGGRTLSVNSTYWETPGGFGLALSVAPGAKDIVGYHALDNGKVFLALQKDAK